jgi:hypothetical protein
MQIAFALTVVSHCQAPVIEDADAIYDITSNSLVCERRTTRSFRKRIQYYIYIYTYFFFTHVSLYHISPTHCIIRSSYFLIHNIFSNAPLAFSPLPANRVCHLNIFESVQTFPRDLHITCMSHLCVRTHVYIYIYIYISRDKNT